MMLLAWVLTISALDPSAEKIIPARPPVFESQANCETTREDFIRAHMYKNWQGLKMAPLVRTACQSKN